MQKKAIFEKYFKVDFLSMVNDRVPNVRICMAKVLRHHFMKEISGEFVFDQDMNDAVNVLKQDSCQDVAFLMSDIETMKPVEGRELTLESFTQYIQDLKMSTSHSDTESLNSEDEMKLENEIRRHNSEDDIDHGPVLRSLRASREEEWQKEQEAAKLLKDQKKKAKATTEVQDLLEEVTSEGVSVKSETE